ncbi:MAG TPA: putative porin [Nitrospirota bacterium]
MRRAFGALLSFCIISAAVPSLAAEFYEDPATGQIYTRPAEGRNKVELPASVGALYQDQETGAVYSKPAEGRAAIETAAPVAAAAEPLKKEEVLAVLPEWMQKVKFGGDLRLRYQWEDTKGKPGTAQADAPRNRGRVRLRFGADAEVVKSVKVGLGIATGSDNDPRSTNQTFQDSFAKKQIWLDYAYMTFAPNENFAFTAGRMKNPLYTAGSDVIWDTDIRPEGAAVALNYDAPLDIKTFFNGAFFVLEENKFQNDKSRNANMFVVQPGLEYKITKDLGLKASGSYYSYQNIAGNAPLTGRASTNTLLGNKYRYDFDAVSAEGELNYKTGFDYIPSVGVFGQYIHNVSSRVPVGRKNAALYGVKFGYDKVVNAGDWNVRTYARRIERDAVPSVFPDSDVFSGDTMAKGMETELTVGLLKNTNLVVDWIDSRRIAPADQRRQNILQCDLNYKF